MPHHPHQLAHGDRRLRGGHRGRIMAYFDPDLPREEFASALVNLGELLRTQATVTINEVLIAVPASVEFELVYERTPHGKLKLKLEADWDEEYSTLPSSTNRALSFGAPVEKGA